MAPRKVANKKKDPLKSPVATRTKAKKAPATVTVAASTNNNNEKTTGAASGAKKKRATTATRLSPLEKLDQNILSDKDGVAVLGERRENTRRISKENHHFDLATLVPQIMKEFPGYNVCIWGGSPQLTKDSNKLIPHLILTLVPNNKLPPPFVAYSVKDVEIIEELPKHQLRWNKVAPRVFILQSTKRLTQASIRALSADSSAKEEYTQLWTIIPSEKLQRNSNDKLDIRSVKFAVTNKKGEPIFDSYEKGEGLQKYLKMFVEEYGDELAGDDDEEKQQQVLDVIKKAFDTAREKLQGQAQMLYDEGYDDATLDSIKNIKIFPKGTDEALKATSSYMNKYHGNAYKVL